jgi:hypothetical protein
MDDKTLKRAQDIKSIIYSINQIIEWEKSDYYYNFFKQTMRDINKSQAQRIINIIKEIKYEYIEEFNKL